jgi:hypothetical protein
LEAIFVWNEIHGASNEQADWIGLVEFAKLLTAAKLTGHLVFDPRCLCGDKFFARLYGTDGMILF